jgi:hypothetical protein
MGDKVKAGYDELTNRDEGAVQSNHQIVAYGGHVGVGSALNVEGAFLEINESK